MPKLMSKVVLKVMYLNQLIQLECGCGNHDEHIVEGFNETFNEIHAEQGKPKREFTSIDAILNYLDSGDWDGLIGYEYKRGAIDPIGVMISAIMM